MERSKSTMFRGVKVIVKFPNVGQMIDIEALKQAYTSNRYGVMAVAGVKTTNLALDYVDAISFIQTCVPHIKRMVEIKDYSSMDAMTACELIKYWKEEVEPWYAKCLQELYSYSDGTTEQTDLGE